MRKEPSNNLYRASTHELQVIEFEKPIQSSSSAVMRGLLFHSSQLFSVQQLPTSLLPPIGREQEVEAICTLLQQPEVRFLTLTGPGGVGKTRLALYIHTKASSFFVDGVCFVSLASVRDADLVLPSIAQALGLNEKLERCSIERVQAIMQDKCLLLVLDNFEHVAEAAPQLKKLLAVCPHLKILVTSRTVLGLSVEQAYCVTPLALPDLAHLPPHEELAQVAAVSLFLQRARAIRPDFDLTSENAQVIAQICEQLDGLPLALEMAATRMKLFSPQSLLTRLDNRLSLLTSGTRDAPERQQTLRKTMEWSYCLLTHDEQHLFRLLSVFAGGCSLHAIEAINDATDKQGETLLDAVASLINQSLLQRESQIGDEEQRFTMLETIREYALEGLQQSHEEEPIRQAHAEYYLTQAKARAFKMIGTEMLLWIEWVEREFKNLRAAFYWFLSLHDAEQALALSGALWAFWSQTHGGEGLCWLRLALECCQHSVTEVQPVTKAQALHTAALLEYYRGNLIQADTFADESLQIFQVSCDIYGTARTLNVQGIGALLRGQYSLANAAADESICVLQWTQHTWLLAETFLIQAYSFHFQGDHLQAYTLGKRGLELSCQTGEPYAIIRAAYAQALFAEAQFPCADLRALCEESVALIRAIIEMGHTLPATLGLIAMGAIVALKRQYTWALYLWGKASTLLKKCDALSDLESRERISSILNTTLFSSQMWNIVRMYFSEQAFTSLWDEGQSMMLEQLLTEPEPQTTPTTSPPSVKETIAYSDGLTPREREVLCLLAQGMSSALIAEQLVISQVTVNSHIRTIYSKLSISSRSAATRYALEHRLV